MKNLKFTTLVIIASLLLSWNISSAQEGSYYTITTWKMHVPKDGSRQELNGLLEEFTEKVVKKNSKIISEKVLHHVSGSDLRDLVVISEYASWNDINDAHEEQDALVKKAWPDEKTRSAWYKTFMKYVVTHSDEIYKEYPKMTK